MKKSFVLIRHELLETIGLFFLLLLPVQTLSSDTWKAGTEGNPFHLFSLSGTEVFQKANKVENIRMKTVSYHGADSNILYLDFESQEPLSLRDQAGHSQIKEASYFPSVKSHNGNYSALFHQSSHQLQIQTPQMSFGKKEEHRNLTIEMWIKPIFFYQRSVLFKKEDQRNGKKIGIEIGIENSGKLTRRLYVHLRHLFVDSKQKRHSIYIVSENQLEKDQWQHIALSWNEVKGKLTLYMNGKEEAIQFARESQEIWMLQFASSSNTPLLLASHYFGFIDEFRISRREVSPKNGKLHVSKFNSLYFDYDKQRSKQKTGFVVSKIHRLSDNQKAKFGRLSYVADLPHGTSINFYLRSSDQHFSYQSNLPWERVKSGFQLLSPFQYFQWKAELRSDPNGNDTPILESMSLNYSLVESPPFPQNLRIIPELSKGLEVCLEWKASLRYAVHQGAYRIYYGLHPKKYFGYIVYKPSAEAKSSKKIRFFMNNQVIEKHLTKIQLAKKKSGKLPFLKHNRNYYFAVSAYDSISESKLSPEVYAIIPPLNAK